MKSSCRPLRATLASFCAACALSSGVLFSGVSSAADLQVSVPWVREPVTGQKATGAFMELSSQTGASLVGVSSPVAGIAEIHEMKIEEGIMKMRAIPRLDIPAGKTVRLAPGGYHVMLMNLQQPIKKGSTIPLTLQLEGPDKKTETLEVNLEVRELTASPHRADHHKR